MKEAKKRLRDAEKKILALEKKWKAAPRVQAIKIALRRAIHEWCNAKQIVEHLKKEEGVLYDNSKNNTCSMVHWSGCSGV